MKVGKNPRVKKELDLLTGIITNTKVCQEIIPILDASLLITPYARRISVWVKEYFEQYHEAPIEDINKIYNEEKDKLEDEERKTIWKFLNNLSKTYENSEVPKPNFIIDTSVKFLNQQKILHVTSDIRAAAKQGKVKEGWALLEEARHHQILPASSHAAGATGTELLEMKVGNPGWLIKDVIPMGLSLLCGRPKVGKSLLSVYLVAGLSLGINIFNSEKPPREAKVLILGLEDSWPRLRSRWDRSLKAVGTKRRVAAGEGRTDFFIEWPRNDLGGITKINDWIVDQGPGRKLIIIDCLQRVRPKQKVSGYFYDQDYQAVKEIHDITIQHKNISIIVIHHTTKARPGDVEDAFETISGTTGIYGAADTALILATNKEGRKDFNRRLVLRGRDTEDKDYALSFRKEDFSWVLLGDSDSCSLTEGQEKLLKVMEKKYKGKPAHYRDLAKYMTKDKETIRKMLDRMCDVGAITRIGGGRFRI